MDTGWIGVELFFGISSFIITRLVLKETQVFHSFDFKLFFIRRLLRIYPLYLLSLVLGFVILPIFGFYGISWGTDTHWAYTVRHLPFFMFFISNFSIGLHPAPMSPMLGPLWSVSIEEQFYLLYPWLFKLQNAAKYVALLSIAIFLLSPLIRFQFLSAGSQVIYYFTITRLDSFALGALLAILTHNHDPFFRTPRASTVLGLGLAISIGTFLVTPDILGDSPFRIFTYSAAATTGAFLVLSIKYIPVLRNILSSPFLTQWGKRTYGCYVFMNLSIWFAKLLADQLAIANSTTRFLVIYATAISVNYWIAKWSFNYFEKPFLKLKSRFTRIESRPI